MSRSKKIFAGFAFLFALLLAYVVYDISSRTTFPGRSDDRKQRTAVDTAAADSANVGEP